MKVAFSHVDKKKQPRQTYSKKGRKKPERDPNFIPPARTRTSLSFSLPSPQDPTGRSAMCPLLSAAFFFYSFNQRTSSAAVIHFRLEGRKAEQSEGEEMNERTHIKASPRPPWILFLLHIEK